MPDNATLSAGTADGVVVATDEITDVHYQINKLAFGALDSATLVTTADGAGLPIQGSLAHDAAVTNTRPLLMGGFASAAAPSDVSADVDAVRAWYLRNGAQATVITAAGALVGGDAANGLDVDVTRSALPSGASTSANQTTIIGHVDGIEGLLTTIDADTGNISTKIDTVAGAVSGTEMQVDVLTIAAGDNNIGNVDVASIAAGTNLIGKVNIPTATTGGCKAYSTSDLQETEVEVTTSATTIYGIYAWNLTAAPLWLKLFNTNTVTPGTTAPLHDIMVPANADSDGAGFVVPLPPQGWAFGTALSIHGSATRGTTAADVGSAGNMGVLIFYQD